jgi:hypothetical protein
LEDALATLLSSLRGWALVFIAALALNASRASADVKVLPQALDGAEGNIGFAVNNALTFQELIGTTQTNGLPVGATITGVQFRLNAGSSPNPASTFSNFDLYLGPSTGSTLGTSVAGNQGPGTLQVRSGSYTLDAASYPTGGSPNAFGPVIDFSAPFIYTGGRLLLTASYTTPSSQFSFDAGTGLSDIDYRQTSAYNSPTVDQQVAGAALATQFVYTVPEPASLGALAGIGALALRRRSRAN